jgi:hypothetical protein
VLTVGTATAAGAVLRTQDITVNYNVLEPLAVPTPTLNSSFVFGHSTSTLATTLPIVADPSTQWKATSNKSWVSVPAGIFTGNNPLPINIDASALTPGNSSALITIANDVDPGDSGTITVNAVITDPPFVAAPSPAGDRGDDGLRPHHGGDFSVTTRHGHEHLSTHRDTHDAEWRARGWRATPSGRKRGQ